MLSETCIKSMPVSPPNVSPNLSFKEESQGLVDAMSALYEWALYWSQVAHHVGA